MKKTIIIQVLFIATTITCFGQSNYSSSILSGQITSRSCHRSIENKAIGLCYTKADTLIYDQLKGCKVLTTGENGKQVITSFKLGYFLNDTNTFIERYVPGNKIPEDIVDAIVKSGIRKIIFSEILGVEGPVNLDLGYRWFYFK